MPFAESAKDRQRPSAASPPCRANSTKVVGLDITVTPPASASEHSPARSDWAARCSATSEEEQAVSTVTAGPTVPKKYDRRPETTLVALPVRTKPWTSSSGPTRYSPGIAPTKTPVRLPRTEAGSMPAPSNASQAASSSTRCWGSMESASRGEIPKKSASNSAAPRRNPPWISVGPSAGSSSQPRSAGRPETPSSPLTSMVQRSSGLATPPG
ncbi:hypothetical protein GCM10010442_53010 [Kitasatospora kifunensis]